MLVNLATIKNHLNIDAEYTSDDNYLEILKPYIDRNLVTLIDWPYDQAQIKAYNHFYETHFCQDDIVASIELDEKYSFFDVQKLKAKDKQLEVNSSFVISNSEHAINQFIKENEANMRSQTIYSLKVYASRLAYKE